MAIKLISLTISSCNPTLLVEFYSCLGLKFEKVSVSRGSQVSRAQQGEVEICISGVMNKINSGTPALHLRFQVEDLEGVFEKISAIPGVTVLLGVTQLSDGKKMILSDPDGNSIEVTEAYEIGSSL